MTDPVPVWGKVRVGSLAIVTPGVFELWLEAPAIARQASPGQFVMVDCGDDTLLRRPISIHRVNAERTAIALLFAIAGKGTRSLADVKTGTNVDVLGPLGNGFIVKPKSKKLLLIAGGLGLAPLYFLADAARISGKQVTLLVGAATAKALYPVPRLPDNASCVVTTDDGSFGRRGFVTEHLSICDDTIDQVFACGPLPMLSALASQSALTTKGLQVSLETRMACGLGVCYGCSIETLQGLKQVCKHGPVFNASDIIWNKLRPV